ncbi:hypothetical protein O5182_24335 [Escherichia coli]|nr:hypothetical protein [Escherichia coli]
MNQLPGLTTTGSGDLGSRLTRPGQVTFPLAERAAAGLAGFSSADEDGAVGYGRSAPSLDSSGCTRLVPRKPGIALSLSDSGFRKTGLS